MSAALILGILIGAILGLTGAGGALLAVPALVFSFGWSMQQAGSVALIAVAISASIGAWDGYRKRILRLRGALLMALAGMPMTWVGAHLAGLTSQANLQAMFALAMLAAALRMVKQSMVGDSTEEILPSNAIATVCKETGRFQWTWQTALILSAIGGFTGLLTGLLGVGGGFIMVPLLRRFSNVSMHAIVTTSLLVIAIVGMTGVVGSVARGVELPLLPTAMFTASCIGGMYLGRKLSQHLSARAVQRSFAALLVVIALWILAQVFGKF